MHISIESVTRGHPDKVADQISDAILDSYLEQDPYSRVACEVLVTKHKVIVAGEVTSKAEPNIEQVVRDTIKEIGYIDPNRGFYYGVEVEILLNRQSADIALGVDKLGAGDQGNMFGYATDESENLMPYGLNLAHNLSNILYEVGKKVGLGPDGKVQLTLLDRKIEDVVVSIQHPESISLEGVKEIVKEKVLNSLGRYENSYINPTGRFVVGGPCGDAGLTGRKIIIDAYGPYCKHGGGAFSGKDPTKVDRSGAYAARWIAKNIVAAKLAKRCEVQLSYVIGHEKPASISINTFGGADNLKGLVEKHFDLRPAAIIERLNLRKPIYKETSCYGHFGRDFSWEKLDKVEDLLS